MVLVSAYHRPKSVADALALLSRPNVKSELLGGGTSLNPRLTDTQTQTSEPVEVIDLQSSGLAGISTSGGLVTIGATTTLQHLYINATLTDGLRDLARREQPSTLRTIATVGGTIGAANPESEFLAGLLAHRASVEIINGGGTISVSLAELVTDRSKLNGSIITAVTIEAGGETESDRTARTPMDVPIVCVVGHRSTAGAITLAATGVAPTVAVVTDGQGLEPPSDFRGSSSYRLSLLRTHIVRVSALLAK
jgi:CO/xanthine dehydrogenase FAD-binding subunit